MVTTETSLLDKKPKEESQKNGSTNVGSSSDKVKEVKTTATNVSVTMQLPSSTSTSSVASTASTASVVTSVATSSGKAFLKSFHLQDIWQK